MSLCTDRRRGIGKDAGNGRKVWNQKSVTVEAALCCSELDAGDVCGDAVAIGDATRVIEAASTYREIWVQNAWDGISKADVLKVFEGFPG